MRCDACGAASTGPSLPAAAEAWIRDQATGNAQPGVYFDDAERVACAIADAWLGTGPDDASESDGSDLRALCANLIRQHGLVAPRPSPDSFLEFARKPGPLPTSGMASGEPLPADSVAADDADHCTNCGAPWAVSAARADTLAALREENAKLRHAIDNVAPYVDCLCPGCPRKVPQAWVSGMCGPCGEEDCEHEDGAKARIAELEGLVAAVEQDRERLRVKLKRGGAAIAKARREAAEAERAALAEALDANYHGDDCYCPLCEVIRDGLRPWLKFRAARLPTPDTSKEPT